MARALFSVDALLDAVRAVALARGVRSTTVAAVAREAGAPVGSIYHRFDSLDDLLAGAWARAVARSHDSLEATDTDGLPREHVVAHLAAAAFDFCLTNPDDMQLLDVLDRVDVGRLTLSAPVADRVEMLDRKAAELVRTTAEDLLGSSDPAARDAVLLMFVDLPQAFARRHAARRDGSAYLLRSQLICAARAVLDSALGAGGTAP